MVHLAMTNMTKKDLQIFLDNCKDLGIRNILAIRGDPPRGYDSWVAVDDDLQHSADLVRFIRKEYGEYFSIFVGAYPEGHHNSQSLDEDIEYLKQKVDSGADGIITQLFYDTNVFFKFVDKCIEKGIDCPIIPGLMPMQTYATFVRIVSFTNITVPSHVWNELEPIKHNDEKVKEYGINYTVKMCKEILDRGINTLHFYTFNLERSVTSITEKLNVYYATTTDKEMMIRSRSYNNLSGLGLNNNNLLGHHSNSAFDLKDIKEIGREFPWDSSKGGYLRRKQETVRPIFWANRQQSYLTRTAHWDEFPNGRWGDSRSPAYGEFLDHHLFRQNKLTVDFRKKMWGNQLKSYQDVYNVFISYLNNKISQLPWCNQQIGQETLTFLLEPLKLLNSFGFLTINSQPQVNGAPSTDPIVGWGDNNGYVYQKAYLEFFCSKQNCEKLLSLIDEDKEGKYGSLSYQAINIKAKLVSNVDLHSVNAVTWGVFTNCEILQPTIVDPQSFIAWKDEAFSLWSTMWQSIYDIDSKSYNLINDIKQNWFLVNIVENDYINGNIFEPFVELYENDKNSKHIRNVFKSAIKSQNKMWCCSTWKKCISPTITASTNIDVNDLNNENECKLNQYEDDDENNNDDNGGNNNPYLDEKLLLKTGSSSNGKTVFSNGNDVYEEK